MNSGLAKQYLIGHGFLDTSSGRGQKVTFWAIFGPLFGSILGPLFGGVLARFRLEVPSFPAWRGSHFGTQKWPKNGSKTNQNGPVSMDVIFPYRRAPRGRGPNPQKRGFWAILCVISSMGPPRAPTPESGGPDLIPGEGWKCQKGPFFDHFWTPFWVIFGTPFWEVLATEPRW